MTLQLGPHRAYVGNIPFKATSDDIKSKFSEFGNLIVIDLKQGFCFVVDFLIFIRIGVRL